MKSNGLPKGIIVDHGYLQVRIHHGGKTYCKNFGKDCTMARELAMIHLAKKREEILLGKFGYTSTKLPRKTFQEVADIYFGLWSKQLNSDGIKKHTERAIRGVRG